MLKFWTLFCLGLVLTSVNSQSCSDTSFLRSYFGFQDTPNVQPLAQNGINFCNSIKSGPVCCLASDMNTFQTKSDQVITTLTQQAAARDTSFSQIGQNPAAVTASLTAAITAVNTAVQAQGGGFAALVRKANATGTLSANYAGFGSFSTNINPINSASPTNPVINGRPTTPGRNNSRLLQDIGSNSASTSINVYGVLANLDSIQSQLASASSQVTSNTAQFQAARSACAVELFKVQAAAWCLSCDVNASLKGWDPTRLAFTMGTDVCNRLKSACYPYLSASNLQNSAFNQQMLIASLQFATTSLNGGSNPVGQTFTYAGQQPASVPSGCTSVDSCNWICTTLFNNGQVNTVAFINGGNVASTSSRLLAEVEAAPELSSMRPRQLAERELSSGTFNPSPTEAGTTVTFAADPAGITLNTTNSTTTTSGGNAKSGMLTYGSVLGGMIAMIWSMMM